MPRSAIRASSTSSRSSRWLPPIISPMPGASASIAATVLVVVYSHVEGFNILWIIQHDDGPLDVLLSEIALVLRLQIHSPLHGKLEFLLCPLKNADRFAVVHAHEFGANDILQLRHESLLNPLVKKC